VDLCMGCGFCVLVCSSAPSSSWLYAHERKTEPTITVIMLVQWKQQMKFRIIKKASSDYSLFYVVALLLLCEALLLLCALVDHGCVLMLMKENRKQGK
jgi:ferredoxin